MPRWVRKLKMHKNSAEMRKTMSLNSVPSGERIHIGVFGKRNAGKSSIVNGITGQSLSIVSDVMGTTTDPVSKAMELLPLGPVVMTDTPGIDDEGELGALRVKKSYQILNKTDIGLLVADGTKGLSAEDRALIEKLKEKNIPFLIVMNKADQIKKDERTLKSSLLEKECPNIPVLWVSTASGENIHELKEAIAGLVPEKETKARLVGDLLKPMDLVVLVIPIDAAAPKGRLILPQQQTIRDILEANGVAVAVKETHLSQTLASLGKKPRLVITDSQVFAKVAKETPEDILLTSFSILFARMKGNLMQAVKGAKAIDDINDGDTILIGEGCTHHRQCDDIGTVKLPCWIGEYTKKQVNFEFTSGTQFPDDLSKFKMIIHCGGCTLNEKEMRHRLLCAENQGVPMTNYGILIAYIQGILKRTVEVFPDIAAALEGK